MTPNCIKCGGTAFAITEVQVQGSKFRLYAVHCTSCGGTVGFQEFFNTGALLTKLAKKLGFTLD